MQRGPGLVESARRFVLGRGLAGVLMRGPQFTVFVVIATLGAVVTALAVWVSPWWWVAVAVLAVLTLLGLWDLVQSHHSILRNYPVVGHLRYLAEELRPEIHQYFVESDTDGAPFDRDTRSLIYQRAKDVLQENPFGTELDLDRIGCEWLAHSVAPREPQEEQFRVRVGGPECTRPYEMSLFNVSAMSFGALSANAVRALNLGARRGGFAHDTGEGGVSPYHLQGGDLVWEIGSGYFGCRAPDGGFDPARFTDTVGREEIKCVSVKLSQGAKAGVGGVLPGAKVSPEIAAARGVPVGVTCISPPYHREFSSPRGLVEFVERLRKAAGGKPTGFKLCIGRRSEFLGILKAILATGIHPDFIIVDGSEGGTGAGPPEFADHMGMPLTEGLILAHQALVGCGLRDRIRLAASGKVTSGYDLARRLAQGADYTNSARGMMFALGCIQAQRCHDNTCPVGVTTQDPRRVRGLVVADKAERVWSYHRNTVASFNQILAAMGLERPEEIGPQHLYRRTGPATVLTYAELYDWLGDGQLVAEPPEGWRRDWERASPDAF
jgi:glutamate synthase domain-containing protein 2